MLHSAAIDIQLLYHFHLYTFSFFSKMYMDRIIVSRILAMVYLHSVSLIHERLLEMELDSNEKLT